MKKLKIVNGIWIAVLGLSVGMISCKKEGCTDPKATNYEKKANHDDGSCKYDTSIVVPPGEVTELTDHINVPTTLAAGNYKVCQSIDVNAALTISPGCTFTFCAGKGLTIRESGSIKAIGTAALPIVFQGESEALSYWAGIAVKSNNPNNQLDFVTIKNAGGYWGWENAGLYVGSSARLTLKNSTITGSSGNGMYVESNATLDVFSGNTFSGSTLAGLNISARQMGSIDVASNYNSGNGEAFIVVRGATLATPQTWPAVTTPILIKERVTVNAALTINAGLDIMLAAGDGIEVGASGSLNAIGTAAAPIKVRGQFESAGYAAGIRINSNNPANKLQYVQLSHLGSYWAWEYSGIHVNGRLEIDNCTINNSNSWGVYVNSSSTLISNGSTQTTAAGVTATNTLTGNGMGPDADCVGGGCTVYFE